MTVKHVKETYEITITLTPEQYNELNHSATWNGMSLESYLVHAGQHYRGSGC